MAEKMDDFYVRYYVGHKGKFGHEFLEFEFRPDGRLRYANNSNYKNDVMIRKESYCTEAPRVRITASAARTIAPSLRRVTWLVMLRTCVHQDSTTRAGLSTKIRSVATARGPVVFDFGCSKHAVHSLIRLAVYCVAGRRGAVALGQLF